MAEYVKRPKRFWFFTRRGWTGSWFSRGGDEWGQATVVLPLIPYLLWVVIAYKWCQDIDCRYMRMQTACFAAGFNNDPTPEDDDAKAYIAHPDAVVV